MAIALDKELAQQDAIRYAAANPPCCKEAPVLDEPPLNDPDAQAECWYARLRSDRATAEDRSNFARWLEEDAAHARAFARVEALWRALDVPSAALRAATPISRRRWVSWRAGLALAASLLLALHAPVAAWLDYVASDYRTDWGETRELALADGSVVTLNSHTALDVDFERDTRRLRLLQGEAFFAVAKDPSRPFVVESAAGYTAALGTRFNVRRDGDRVVVAVEEGRVAVNVPAERTLLESGWQTTYRGAALEREEPADLQRALAWRQGHVVFESRPLAEVVDELNRYTAGRILIVDPSIRQHVVSGVLNTDASGQALDGIVGTLHLRTLRVPGGLVLLAR